MVNFSSCLVDFWLCYWHPAKRLRSQNMLHLHRGYPSASRIHGSHIHGSSIHNSRIHGSDNTSSYGRPVVIV